MISNPKLSTSTFFGLKCKIALASVLMATSVASVAQNKKINDVTTPLHLLKPEYDIPYGGTNQADIKKTLDKVYDYLSKNTPDQMVDKSGSVITDLSKLDQNSQFKHGDYRLLSYEWGVTYTGMLEAGKATGDKRFIDYTVNRINFVGDVVNVYRDGDLKNPKGNTPVRSVLHPHALDDAGSMAAAMIKSLDYGANKKTVRPMVDHYLDYVMNKEFRLKDGTLARNRPQPNTLWLDDLYMSLPAIVQMGKLTGEQKYFDEAIKQLKLFTNRMFNKEKGLYMHGWVQDMNPHPQFHWARANGWAILTMVEILDALPKTDKNRPYVIDLLNQHAYGLAKLQDKTGFWHQLLDKNDSYLETSATAIYAYCFARAIDKGVLDAKAYGPATLLAWNAVATKVNQDGQVEGTCVGTGMGFDPAFYYYRPINNYAAHGYGPVLLAGAEVYKMLEKHQYEINDSSVQITN